MCFQQVFSKFASVFEYITDLTLSSCRSLTMKLQRKGKKNVNEFLSKAGVHEMELKPARKHLM